MVFILKYGEKNILKIISLNLDKTNICLKFIQQTNWGGGGGKAIFMKKDPFFWKSFDFIKS